MAAAIYDEFPVIAALAVAMIASYTALELIERIKATAGRSRSLWILGGATGWGLGLWSIHRINLLAYHLSIVQSGVLSNALISLLVTICICGMALLIAGSLVQPHAPGGQAESFRSDRNRVRHAFLIGTALTVTDCAAIAIFHNAASMGLQQELSGVAIGTTTVIVLIFALAVSWLDRRLDIEIARSETLYRSEKRIYSLLQNISDIIMILNREGRICYTSASVSQNLECGLTTRLDQTITELVHPDDRHLTEEILQKIRSAEQSKVTTEIRLQHVNGSWHIFDTIAQNLLDEPSVSGIVVTCRDITERKQAEAEMHKALAQEKELRELKSRFIATTSHEFRTPLATILASSDLLKIFGHRLSEEKKLERLNKIQTEVLELTRMTDEILLLNKTESEYVHFHPVSLDLKQLCQDTLNEARTVASDSHTLLFNCSTARAKGFVDRDLLHHILTNLLSNAVKYSPQGGIIHLYLECEPNQITLHMSDQGIGIPAADRDQIFEPFYRAGNVNGISGTGLGLTVVKRAVDLHNGHINFTSELGAGSVFTVILPRWDQGERAV